MKKEEHLNIMDIPREIDQMRNNLKKVSTRRKEDSLLVGIEKYLATPKENCSSCDGVWLYKEREVVDMVETFSPMYSAS